MKIDFPFKKHFPVIEHQSSGFSLIEVMIALVVFGLFVTAYVASEGNILLDSTHLKNESILQRLCENKMSEIILAPPKLDHDITLTATTGNFEEEGFPDYEYTVTYKELVIPNLSELQGKSSSGESGEDSTSSSDESSKNGSSEKSEGTSSGKSASRDSSQSDEENDDSNKMNNQVFKIMKENIETAIWQVEVSVNRKGTTFPYVLSGLIKNPEAKIEIRF